MKCNDFKAIWSAWCDGDLSAEMADSCQKHLEECPACAQFDKKLREIEHALVAAGEERFEPPARLYGNIMSGISARKPGFNPFWKKFISTGGLAVAAMLVAAFVAGIFTKDFMTPRETAVAVNRVKLEFKARESDQVGLVGDFNQWGKKEVPIHAVREGGKWIFELELMPGSYQYAFEVNGKKWLPDPRATGIIPDGFGGMNSVLFVPTASGQKTN